MEVFIRNLDKGATNETLEEWLVPILKQYGISIYQLHKKKGKPFANLTVTDGVKAQAFMAGIRNSAQLPRHPRTHMSATFAQSRNMPDPQLIKALRTEEKNLMGSRDTLPNIETRNREKANPGKNSETPLRISSIACGRWETRKGLAHFVPYSEFVADGALVQKGRGLMLEVNLLSAAQPFKINFENFNVQSILVAPHRRLVLTLSQAPKLYGQPDFDSLWLMMQHLLRTDNGDAPQMQRKSKLPDNTEWISGTCLVYCVTLKTETPRENLTKRIAFMTSKRFPLWPVSHLGIEKPLKSFRQQIDGLDLAMRSHSFPFVVRFQAQALWANATMSPHEVEALVPLMKATCNSDSGEDALVTGLHHLTTQMVPLGPEHAVSEGTVRTATAMLTQFLNTTHLEGRVPGADEVSIHRAFITPTGVYLYGPEKEPSNRVIRTYAGHEDCFMRVTFADEDGEKIMFDAEASNDAILRGRFLSMLQNGFSVGGELFEFLGFSHSSLRSQSCWFMRSFIHNGNRIKSSVVIKSLGDFSHITCPAKCAARIGQAFSDTAKGITIDTTEVLPVSDIMRNGFTFTDGCGTVSASVCRALGRATSKDGPTLFQIRYKGAKGMVSLDSRLPGHQMRLRPSMIKFTGSPSHDIEICGTNARHPLKFKLNRQIIKILEDLGVEYDAFKTLQDQAIKDLQLSATSAQSAVGFVCSNLADSSTGISELIRCLIDHDIDATEDEFIRSIIRGLIEVQLRELKFRSRIPVKNAVTLYGICDEEGTLDEGQVYVTFRNEIGIDTWSEGPVIVTRSPALHPGDIQVVTAVGVPPQSMLCQLTNCVVFSQKGARDLPSMLSGGDLDGDLFNVIMDKRLIPRSSDTPAAYPPAETVDVGRPVTADDIAAFFVNFMESDQLGRIATLHQVYADRNAEGTRSLECLKLAQLHSAAVDFSKSGKAVNIKAIPKAPVARPDFMVPSVSTKIHRGIKSAEEAADTDVEKSQKYRYYESERVLGKLFRSINEDDFFNELQDDNVSIFSCEGTDDVVGQMWDLVVDFAPNNDWQNYQDTAQQVKEYYNTTLMNIMSQYAVGRTQSLTEKEVLIGTIIGRPGAASKHQREQSDLMRLRYKREVQHIRQWMKAETQEEPGGYLSLAIACLSLYFPAGGVAKQPELDDHLRSFPWFAAAICVPMLTRQNTNPR